MVEPTPWPKMPPPGVPRAVDLVADVLHDAFKGDTDVDLDLLAAEVVDALQGKALTVELRWYDGEGITGEGVVVLGRTEQDAMPGVATTAMCSSGDHDDVPAVGDALIDGAADEPDNRRYPYCAACLDVLGSDFDARRWEGAGGHETQQVGRQFRSNACIHEEHGECEEECPYCADACACPCHSWHAANQHDNNPSTESHERATPAT